MFIIFKHFYISFYYYNINYKKIIIFISLILFLNLHILFIFENCFNALLAVPRIAFCSCKKRGFLQTHADKPTGKET